MSEARSNNPAGWLVVMQAAKEAYWQARAAGIDEADALWRAVDAAVGVVENSARIKSTQKE